MSADEKRVVLIKPGDTLLIGGVGALDHDQHEAAAKALRSLGFDKIGLFAGDICIDALPGPGGQG